MDDRGLCEKNLKIFEVSVTRSNFSLRDLVFLLFM